VWAFSLTFDLFTQTRYIRTLLLLYDAADHVIACPEAVGSSERW